MKKLLFVDACVSDHVPSRTRMLCNAFLEKYYGQWQIDTIVLETAGLYPFTSSMLQHRDRCVADQDFSSPEYDLVHRVAEADMIVVGAPYWDFSFPSLVKIFVEHIMVNGITFHYTERGAEGLCRAERLIYITTAGGELLEPDWGYGYIQAIAGAIGIHQVQCIAAQRLDMVGVDIDGIMAEAMTKAREME